MQAIASRCEIHRKRVELGRETRRNHESVAQVPAEVRPFKKSSRQSVLSSPFAALPDTHILTPRPGIKPTPLQRARVLTTRPPGSPMSLNMFKLLQFFQIIQAFFLTLKIQIVGETHDQLQRKISELSKNDSPIILRKTIPSH